MPHSFSLVSENRCFGGRQQRYRHVSESLACDMHFAIYLPPQTEMGQKVPVLYWLSGLTCTDENFVTKAGAQRAAAELGIAVVCPDTSPRGPNVADDAHGAYDFGLGAGFYVNATKAPYASNYKMYDYIVSELPAFVESKFPVNDKKSISGHSMGGHGALTIALKNHDIYQSVSAFSPITHPSVCPWGIKALTGYLGKNKDNWKDSDAVELILSGKPLLPALIDQGDNDNFLVQQLRTQDLIDACEKMNQSATIRMQPNYDHSYFFISTFIEEHLKFHAQYLSE